jgi:hypothetical protein
MAVATPQRPHGLENSSPILVQAEPGAGGGGEPASAEVSRAASMSASVDPSRKGVPLDELELEDDELDELEELDERAPPLDELLELSPPLEELLELSPLLPGATVSASLHAMTTGTANVQATNSPNLKFRMTSLMLLKWSTILAPIFKTTGT